jgi:exonuclease SbcD
MTKSFRLLHTSDWHLGRPLYGRRRYAEYEAFLSWLAGAIERAQVDALLVAGDVFDSAAPSTQAQALYYRFLGRVARAGLRQVVVIAGNHDSPALLAAPAEILKTLDIHVLGTISPGGANEIIILKDENQTPRLIAAAVPYPRDRDLREASAGESLEDKERKLLEAVREHYRQVARGAEAAAETFEIRPPLVALGHLFVLGGRTVEGDGVGALYVGSLGQVPADIFSGFDYVALGHLHQPQIVGGDPTRRYSGAPLHLNFSEGPKPKSVTLVDFQPGSAIPAVSALEVPIFQTLRRLSGDMSELEAALEKLRQAGTPAWLEIEYAGAEIIGDLRARLGELTADSGLDILRVRNNRPAGALKASAASGDSLEVLTPDEIFRRCLETARVPENSRPELWAAYSELLRTLTLEDDEKGGL